MLSLFYGKHVSAVLRQWGCIVQGCCFVFRSSVRLAFHYICVCAYVHTVCVCDTLHSVCVLQGLGHETETLAKIVFEVSIGVKVIAISALF